MRRRRLQHRVAPYLFVAPFLALFAVFGLYPMAKSLLLAGFITYGPESRVFVGLGNFAAILSDPSFHKAVWNTAVFACGSVFVQLPMSLGLALLVNSRFLKGRAAFRFGFFSPFLLGQVFVAVLFSVIYAPRFGLLNTWIHAVTNRSAEGLGWLNLTSGAVVALVTAPLVVHLATVLGRAAAAQWRACRRGEAALRIAAIAVAVVEFGAVFLPGEGLLARALGTLRFPIDRDWLGEAPLVMPALILTALWMYVGFNMIYFLAALQAVDRDLYDAAHVDGAGAFGRFWHVTLPSIRPVAVFVVVLSTIGSFQLFELPYVMLQQSAGPGQSGLTIVMYLYQKGFEAGDLGYASAVGWILALGVMVLAVAQLRLSGTWKREA
jgi:ABC-type sugar transport system permease subunit